MAKQKRYCEYKFTCSMNDFTCKEAMTIKLINRSSVVRIVKKEDWQGYIKGKPKCFYRIILDNCVLHYMVKYSSEKIIIFGPIDEEE